jgi:hypothetical protein
MPTPVVCPSCGSSLDIPAELLGSPVRCASCASVFTPPGEPGAVPARPDSVPPRLPARRSRRGCLWASVALVGLTGFCCCGGCFFLFQYVDNPKFQPYTAPDQSYSAKFPGTPSPVNRTGPTGKKLAGADYRRDFPVERFFVEYAALSPAEAKEDPQKVLNAACDTWLATVPGGQEVRRYPRDVDGHPAMDLFVETGGFQQNNLYVRVVIAGDRLYSVGIAGQIMTEHRHGDEFLDAFRPGKKE